MSDDPILHVSDTALWVASHRARESERPDALYHDPLAAKLAGQRGIEIARKMPYRAMLGWIMVVRTVAIDRLIAESIADGVDTVINLGAGLDTRPYRLDLPKSMKWIEVDFPHMIDLKNEQLAGETPRCELKRIGLDLSQRDEARRLYSELGNQTRRALVVTEGVVPYLTNEQAADLAEDLRSVPSFHYWILDYRRHGHGWGPPPALRKMLANAPFRFQHSDPLAFFSGHGWRVKHDVLAVEEGERLGRPMPIPLLARVLTRIMPAEKRARFRGAAGYALLQPK